MHYDVAIIGAGMSGLAAGIRLAYFDKRVCIFDRHQVYGGLNSFYTLNGRQLDVGLHAVTNFTPPSARNAPLAQLFRQLRLNRDEFELCPQHGSEIRFPGRTLRVSNDPAVLVADVAEQFPREIDNFRRFVEEAQARDYWRADGPYASTRAALAERLRDPLLIEMLLCPLMYYGSAQPHDMDFGDFVTLFKSILCDGLARPRGGVRTLIRALVKQYRACGGLFRMGCGVRRLVHDHHRVVGLELDSGEQVTADQVLSSAGYFETLQLCTGAAEPPPPGDLGQLSFVESIAITNVLPARFGLDATIIFFNDAETFTYAPPDGLIDVHSGVVCCSNNFEQHEDEPEGIVRLTSLADPQRWDRLDADAYAAAKRDCSARALAHAIHLRIVPDFRDRVGFTDTFTPRTIRRFTGRLNGAVYGTPRRIRDGRTHLENLFICGTDQGFVGIIGTLMSGIAMANQHVLTTE